MEEENAPAVSSCDDTETIVESDTDEIQEQLDDDQQDDLNATFLIADDSALKLAQRELSTASEQDISWIAEPLQYKKKLFDQMDECDADMEGGDVEMHHEETNMLQLSDPTPSKATVAAKIARFEHQLVQQPSSSASSSGDGISVYLRTRPSSDTTNTVQHMSATTIRTHAPETSNAAKFVRGNGSVVKEYSFRGVFSESISQESVYQATVQHQLSGIFEDKSTLIFCYGITNAGKTYTVTGPEECLNAPNQEWGLVPRSLRELYELCNGADERLVLSFFEVYNEQIYDLLVKNPSRSLHADTGIDIKHVSCHNITSVEHGLQLIAAAQKARVSGTNRINARSSRSHAVCRMTVGNADLWIVDLAGSERAKRTGGIRWQEAAQINKSLSTLNRCLMALRRKNNVLPPYRESKLTQLFGNHWTGNSASRTTMIVNINPAASDFDETQHVLEYASAAKTVVMENVQKPETHAEYGYDGRRLRKSCMKKIKAVVRKLSPKRATTKPKSQHPKNKSAKRKQSPSLQGSSKRARFDHTHEVISLREELKMAKTENASLQEDYAKVSSNVNSIELRIRAEVEKEMEEKIQSLKKQHDASSGTNSEHMTELLDTIAECEDEMDRMREQYVADLALHKNKYERIMADKDFELEAKEERVRQLEQQIVELKMQMNEDFDNNNSNLALKQQVKDLQQEIKQLSKDMGEELRGKQEYIEQLEEQVESLKRQLVECSEQAESDKTVLERQIGKLKTELEASRSEIERSKRSKTNFIAQKFQRSRSASDIENQFPKSRSGRYQATHEEVVDISSRRVFGSVVNNKSESLSDTSDSNCSFGPSQWLKPRQKVKLDPTTGKFLRPRGRAPAGAEAWDESKGAWRLSYA